jgi:hypothetical protein
MHQMFQFAIRLLELSHHMLSEFVLLITFHNLLEPVWSAHCDSQNLTYRNGWVLRQGICDLVVASFLVLDAILKSNQLSERHLLPRCSQALLIQVR